MGSWTNATAANATLTIPGWSLLTGHSGMEPATAVLIYAFCDLAACLIFLAGYLWLKPGEAQEGRQVDKMTTTADDFTVYLPRVPPHTTEAHVREYFAGLTAAPSAEAANLGLYGLFDLAQVHLVEDNAATVTQFMKRGKVLMAAERLVQEMRYVNHLAAQGRPPRGCCAPRLPALL